MNLILLKTGQVGDVFVVNSGINANHNFNSNLKSDTKYNKVK